MKSYFLTVPKSMLKSFYSEARVANRYDFEMGSKLRDCLVQSGLKIISEQIVPDEELSFTGAARPEVLGAWKQRLARMKGLQRFAGDQYSNFEAEFMSTLSKTEHQSLTRVHFVLAKK